MTDYSHLDLIQERYPHPNSLSVYRALCFTLSSRAAQVDWNAFTPEDWDLLLEMATREGLGGLLYRAWREGARPPAAPKMMIARLGADFFRVKAQYAAFEREIESVIAPMLAASHSSLVLLKGAALARGLYFEAGLRPMADIDCLAHQDEIERITEALMQCGYTHQREGLLVPGVAYQEYHYVLLSPGAPSIMLEVHHSLARGRQEFYKPDMEWFLAHTERHISGQECLRVFDPAAQLLHLVIHLLVNHGEGESDLLHFYDIHLLMERWGGRIDWQELMTAAQRMNLDYVLYAGLQGSAVRFGTPIPVGMQSPPAGKGAASMRKFIETRSHPVPPTHTERYLKMLANRPLRTQLDLAVRYAFPAPEFMRRRYKLRPGFLWPFSYPLRWLIGLGHLLKMTTRRWK